MCGLLGLIAPVASDGIRRSGTSLQQALSLLAHRGPDARQLVAITASNQAVRWPAAHAQPDTWPACPPVILGHTRLSIIDPHPRAHQPMSAHGAWIVYNGEIYNHQALRTELQQQGVVFQSASDTEVLLALYARYGPSMINRLNGMFAFALWDPHSQTLLLARDRYGIKPLYYTTLPTGELAFASEIKSLLALGADKTLDMIALSEHLTFQNMLEGRTLLRHIHLLQPGHWASLHTPTSHWQMQTYWTPRFDPDGSRPYTEPQQQAEHLYALLDQAVQRQLVGESPVGSFLSGGMDTSAITTLAARYRPHLPTFTAGFDTRAVTTAQEHLFDERTLARQWAHQLDTRHHEITLDEHTLPEVFSRVVWHLDDFRAGISYQNFEVNRLVKRHVTVTLSGVGGDELFAGYPWRYEPILTLNDTANTPFEEHYYASWVRLLSETEKQRLWSPASRHAVRDFDTRDSFRRELAHVQAEHPLHRALGFDMRTFLHGLLIVEDRLSMAHALESRVPFLDNDLVDWCLRLPADYKLRQGTSKWILKAALEGLLPPDILHRRKQGFTPPDASWYRGPLRPMIEALLLSPTCLERGLFEPRAIRDILDAHWRGERNHRFLIWSLMCLEQWHRLFIDPPSPVEPRSTV